MTEECRYFTKTRPDEPFFIELAGVSYCDGTYRIERRDSPVNVLEYIIRGTGTVISENIPYTASSGDVYLLHQGSNHVYYSDAQNPWTKIWFNFYGPLANLLFRAYDLDNTIYVPNCNAYGLFRKLMEIVDENLPQSEKLKRCSLVFHEIIQYIAETTRRENRTLSPEVQALKNYLDNKVSEKVTLKELSDLIYRSESQTIRIFKNEMNITPLSYLLGKKMEVACVLMKSTKKPIKEIALELGFSDQHYFSNVFKAHTGKSPRFYRSSV